MTYEFKRTEKNLGKGAEFETKSLLYLAGLDRCCKKVSFIFIDCFNDISGTDKNFQGIWDFQAKGLSKMGPEKIGRSLITLFLNDTSKRGLKNTLCTQILLD